MTLCSSALRWANFTPRPMCGNTLAYPTITLLLYPSISHATMGRFDNGNYLAHWIPTSVPISRPICLPVALLMMVKSRLTIGRLMWKLLGLKSYNPQTWSYEQIRGAEVKPCLRKIFLLFVPHVTLMIGILVKWKFWEGRMHSPSFIRLNLGKTVASNTWNASTPRWIGDILNSMKTKLTVKIQNSPLQCLSSNLCGLVFFQTGPHLLGNNCTGWCHLKATVDD